MLRDSNTRNRRGRNGLPEQVRPIPRKWRLQRNRLFHQNCNRTLHLSSFTFHTSTTTTAHNDAILGRDVLSVLCLLVMAMQQPSNRSRRGSIGNSPLSNMLRGARSGVLSPNWRLSFPMRLPKQVSVSMPCGMPRLILLLRHVNLE